MSKVLKARCNNMERQAWWKTVGKGAIVVYWHMGKGATVVYRYMGKGAIVVYRHMGKGAIVVYRYMNCSNVQ